MKSNFNIITTTGFGATGSSAISHIISEFDNVKSYGSIEFWLLQDLHGISDLEYFCTFVLRFDNFPFIFDDNDERMQN